MPSVRAGFRPVLACPPLRAAHLTLGPVTVVFQVMPRFRFTAARGHPPPVGPDFGVHKPAQPEARIDNRLHSHRRSQHDRIGPVVTATRRMVHPVAPLLEVAEFPARWLVVQNAQLSGAQIPAPCGAASRLLA